MNDQEPIGLLTRDKDKLTARRSSNGSFVGAALVNNGHSEPPTDHLYSSATMPEPGAGAAELAKQGIDWPVVIWIALVHMLALVAPVLLQLASAPYVCRLDGGDGLDGRVHGLPSLPHAWCVQNLSASSLAARFLRRDVRRRLGADLGCEPS